MQCCAPQLCHTALSHNTDVQKQRQELQQRVEHAQAHLDGAREKWRHLRLQKQSLNQHLKALEEPPSAACPPQHSGHPPIEAQPCKQALPRTEGLRLVCFRRGTPHHHSSEMEEILPISSFLHCEPISFAVLGKHIAPRELQASACHYNVVPRAVEAHQASVAARLRLPASDICWFQQWPFPRIDPPLSFSASASPSCPQIALFCVTLSYGTDRYQLHGHLCKQVLDMKWEHTTMLHHVVRCRILYSLGSCPRHSALNICPEHALGTGKLWEK